ncbi:molybdopterin-dependent oxidoreductase [Lentzea sp. NPDC102401]|uniref:molybdopterin-dependent oxidoreductase n=1 Tax=Lentzea sp. NPDC102401 TaxID=3364128 RepID=UPI0038163D26
MSLGLLLRLAGLRCSAVDVLSAGLDAEYVTGDVNLGRVRRPLPVSKALDDVLVAYEMNGESLPPDHGFLARRVDPVAGALAGDSGENVPRARVDGQPDESPCNTQGYLFGAVVRHPVTVA